MTKIFCDRCENECTPAITITYNILEYGTPEETHLCPNCVNDFRRWCTEYKMKRREEL